MMTVPEHATRATPWWYWVVAVLFLLVQLAGVLQLPPQYLASEAERAAPTAFWQIVNAEPWWATAGYSLAMIAGFFGACCLFPRRARRVVGPLLVAASVGLLAQRAWFNLVSDLTHLVPPVAQFTQFLPIVLNLAIIAMARRAIRLTPPNEASSRPDRVPERAR